MNRNITVRILVFLNTLTFIGMVTVNSLANILPINGVRTADVSGSLTNLLVPDGLTFLIWIVIYLALFISIVYQWIIVRFEDKERYIKVYGPYLIFSNILNGLWILSWHYYIITLSLVVMLLLLYFLSILHSRIHEIAGPLSFNICVRFPISLYYGWVTIATVANITSLLVSLGWNPGEQVSTLWAIPVLILAAIVNILVALHRKDIWFPLVGIWGIMGIYRKRMSVPGEESSLIALAALVCSCAIGITIIITLIIKRRQIAREGYH
ncbi:MAG: hypothetical protein PQJ47_01305 [Sphaerochaetaceae bacterium]|nr:hypothetical protein [Sphaerochaetaceae bacterium]